MLRARAPAILAGPGIVVLLALAACGGGEAFAPPAQAHARADARLGATLSAHLAALTGVEAASVVVLTPWRDPLAPAGDAAPPPTASVILTLRPGADVAALSDAARAAVVMTVANIRADAISISALAAPAPARAAGLTRVGPFEVAARSRGPLLGALAAALIAIAALASWVVALELRRRRPA